MYAIHYCLVIGTTRNNPSLCAAFRSLTDSAEPRFAFGGIHTELKGSSTRPLTLSKNENDLKCISMNFSSQILDSHSDGPTITCTNKKNRQILQNLRPHTKYYVDVFGVHTKLDSLAFRLASTSVWFNRSQPIVLHDDLLLTTKLSDLGKQTIFSFKVKY